MKKSEKNEIIKKDKNLEQCVQKKGQSGKDTIECYLPPKIKNYNTSVNSEVCEKTYPFLGLGLAYGG